MTTITQYFEQAQLSLAAYALNLTPGIIGKAGTAELQAAGNDYILGDHDYLATKAEWSVTPQADGSQFFYPVSSFPADGSVPPDGAADVIYAGAGDDTVICILFLRARGEAANDAEGRRWA